MQSPKKRKLNPEPEDMDFGDDGDREEVFVVERILAQRVQDGETEYLVKWHGYDDDECTWEPPEHFKSNDTIEEWKKQLEAGDTLDDPEVAALEVRIGRRLQAQLNENAENGQKILQAAKARDAGSNTNSSGPHTGHNDIAVESAPKCTIFPKTQGKDCVNASTSKPAQNQNITDTDFATTGNTGPVKFHAIDTFKNTRKSRPSESVKSKPSGTKFRNGRHMNNARKKARDETGHVINSSVRPVAKSAEDLGKMNDPKFSLPSPIHARDDSPLFFPETNGPYSPRTTESEEDPASTRNRSPFSPIGPDTGASSRESKVPAISPILQPPVLRSFKTSTGPRTAGTGDVLIQLIFGQHEVGDVLIKHFPPWLKTKIIRLKAKGDHVLPIHFREDLVFNETEFSELVAHWPPNTASLGVIKPFDDTEEAASSLSIHLGENNLAAVWEYPDSDESIVLILHSPNAKSWWRHAQDPKFQGCPLLVEARNRTPPGVRAGPIKRRLSQSAYSQVSVNGISLHQDHTSQLKANQNFFRQPLIITSTAAPMTPQDSFSSLPNLLPSHSPQRSESILQLAPLNPERRDSISNDEKVSASPAIRNNSIGKKVNVKATNLDWRVPGSFRSLIKATKPLVYIAFAQHYPPQASEALKEWAGKHTSPRFIFADTDGNNEWDDFRSANGSALLLFNEKGPSFGVLKDLWQFVARENSHCYSVRLTEPTPLAPAKYKFSRVFPRGTVLLITEHTILNHTQEAEFAIKWFKQNAKPGPWKIMFRPNIRSWLQQTAMDCNDENKQHSLFNIFGWLYKLSADRDLTVASDTMEQLGSLGLSNESDEDYIVSLPMLLGYDGRPGADETAEAVRARDLRLLDHFIYWSVMEGSKSSKKFIVIDDMESGSDQTASRRKEAGHIRFWSPESFMRSLQKTSIPDE